VWFVFLVTAPGQELLALTMITAALLTKGFRLIWGGTPPPGSTNQFNSAQFRFTNHAVLVPLVTWRINAYEFVLDFASSLIVYLTTLYLAGD
jgi:hypothetical protein